MKTSIKSVISPHNLIPALFTFLLLNFCQQQVLAEGSPSVIDLPLAEAKKTDFFTHFHFEESTREQAEGQTAVSFVGAGGQIFAMVNSQDRVQALNFLLARKLIDEGRGNDIVANFIRAATPQSQRARAEEFAREIFYGHKKYTVETVGVTKDGKDLGKQKFLVPQGEKIAVGKNLIPYPGYIPEIPKTESGVFKTYAGKQAACSQSFGKTLLEMKNAQISGTDFLMIKEGPAK